ncbi:hypothetical protein BFU36_09935 [Sulfolobus sp. A20]|uniref:hypothetical protein n=1 Tax=Saccharolobus sp. A20 TaxID=1891280 RepID=UPI0008461F5A|nr:hypothetical protein [Sulfolobus sp. A20]AOL17802.1 hypothetical protein BFU36_09935 [Sulfolobus sp. A20]TRM74318.1 hypothetical protein DJ523_05175 [Sulfolobus sp. E5]TRM77999.1 hypothetical protein DJ532_02740 [Sulfolobus sp. A20-N-F8]TRM96929.1 hypothetical protein DJ527_12365 [Sulfolobus sp. F1]
MDIINATLLYLVTGNHISYYLLIKIISIENNSILANVTQISNNIYLSYIVSYPSFLIFIPNYTANNLTTYDGILVTTMSINNFTVYIDVYNGIVIHAIGNGENITLIGSTIQLGPNIYRTIPYYILHTGTKNYNKYEYETLALTITLVASFYLILQKVSKK